jgi:hypothetical protein
MRIRREVRTVKRTCGAKTIASEFAAGEKEFSIENYSPMDYVLSL